MKILGRESTSEELWVIGASFFMPCLLGATLLSIILLPSEILPDWWFQHLNLIWIIYSFLLVGIVVSFSLVKSVVQEYKKGTLVKKRLANRGD